MARDPGQKTVIRTVKARCRRLARQARTEQTPSHHESLRQGCAWVCEHAAWGRPFLTLTPDGHLRARWVTPAGAWMAIEFLGDGRYKVMVGGA